MKILDNSKLTRVPLNFDSSVSVNEKAMSIQLVTDSFKRDYIAECNAFNRELYGCDLSEENVAVLMRQDVSKLQALAGEYAAEMKLKSVSK